MESPLHASEGRFYVYELIDPRDGEPFYIGKGQGKRVHQHEKDAKKGAELGRFERIKEIWAAGLKVEKRIVARFDDERRAYEAEADRIADIGLNNLTNRTPGAGFDPEASVDRQKARALLKINAKTNGFTEKRRWLYCEKWHDLPDTFLPAMKGHLDALVAKRGPEWLAAVA